MTDPVRLVLADDHDVFVEGLGMVLGSEPDIDVVAMARDGRGVLRALAQATPDVLVLGQSEPGALEGTLKAVRHQARRVRVLVLTDTAERETVARLLQLGADAFVSKESSGRELLRAIRALAGGQPAPVAQPAVVAVVARRPLSAELELLLRSLSRRERQVLELLANGYSNRRIAEECYLSLNTVRTHVQNVLVKLGVHSKLEAAAFAVRQGLVPFGERAAS